MTLDEYPKSLADLKVWNFDGSSTGQVRARAGAPARRRRQLTAG